MANSPKDFYTAGELAELFHLPKQTLLYYDKMGILKPEFISENNYRHYSLKQYLILEIIINLRKLGIPVAKIKDYLNNRNEETFRILLRNKAKECDEIIARQQAIKNHIALVDKQLHKISNSRLNQINLNFRSAKSFFLSYVSKKCNGNRTIDILAKHNLEVFNKEHFKERAVGWIVDKDSFLQGDYGHPLAFFSTIESIEEFSGNIYTRPSGLYMSMRFQGTFRANVGKLAATFNEFMAANSLKPIGNLYIMPLKNHWLTEKTDEYIYQISIQVDKI